MITESHIRGALVVMRTFAEDLPDGMAESLEDLDLEFHSAKSSGRPVSASGFAAAIRELCNDYGLPAPLPEGD